MIITINTEKEISIRHIETLNVMFNNSGSCIENFQIDGSLVTIEIEKDIDDVEEFKSALLSFIDCVENISDCKKCAEDIMDVYECLDVDTVRYSKNIEAVYAT